MTDPLADDVVKKSLTGEVSGCLSNPLLGWNVPAQLNNQDRRPNPRTYDEALDELLQSIKAMLLQKHRDYGTANLTEFGEIGILVRVNDKFKRLKNLILNKQAPTVKDESIEDTWCDLTGYALQAIMLRRGTYMLPMRNLEERISK